MKKKEELLVYGEAEFIEKLLQVKAEDPEIVEEDLVPFNNRLISSQPKYRRKDKSKASASKNRFKRLKREGNIRKPEEDLQFSRIVFTDEELENIPRQAITSDLRGKVVFEKTPNLIFFRGRYLPFIEIKTGPTFVLCQNQAK